MFVCYDATKDKEGNFLINSAHIGRIIDDLGLYISQKEQDLMKQKLEQQYGVQIPMTELETYFVNMLSGYSEELHRNAFMRLDADGDGKIPREEFEYYLDNFGYDLTEED